jgi:hypothetical protein
LRRRLNYSICIAIVITAVGYVLEDRGGHFVLWPGTSGQVMVQGILLFIPSGDDFYSLPSQSYLLFNVALYSSIILGALLLIPLIRVTGSPRCVPNDYGNTTTFPNCSRFSR